MVWPFSGKNRKKKTQLVDEMVVLLVEVLVGQFYLLYLVVLWSM